MSGNIEAMYELFGKIRARCKECNHLHKYHYHDRNYYKCEIYGESNSAATDWGCGWVACGAFRMEVLNRNIYKMLAHKPKRVIDEEQVEGQISLFREEQEHEKSIDDNSNM